jgi:hypothetical protein
VDMLEISQTGAIIVLAFAVIILAKTVRNEREIKKMIFRELDRHRYVRNKLYESLADPARIEADFEKSARAREMRDANRTTLPREGAGPPAKVYRPKFRNARPGNWRQPRP